MGLWSCAHILLPLAGAGGLGFLGGGYWLFAKYGVKYGSKLVLEYLLSVPTKIFGYALIAFRQKVTVTLAFATAFRDTAFTALKAVQGNVSLLELGKVFLGEVYRQTLLAPKLIAQGLGDWIQFLTMDGVCSQVLSINLLGSGMLSIWTGLSSAIILAFGYRLVKGYVQKQEVDREMTFMFVSLVFLSSALIQVGIEQTQLYTVIERSFSFLDVLSASIPDAGNQSVNQTLNQSSDKALG